MSINIQKQQLDVLHPNLPEPMVFQQRSKPRAQAQEILQLMIHHRYVHWQESKSRLSQFIWGNSNVSKRHTARKQTHWWPGRDTVAKDSRHRKFKCPKITSDKLSKISFIRHILNKGYYNFFSTKVMLHPNFSRVYKNLLKHTNLHCARFFAHKVFDCITFRAIKRH